MESFKQSFLDPIRRFSKRQFALQVLNFLMVVCTALMIWKGLGVLFNTESPIVVVLSGSMEPAFYRGDILFLTMTNEPIRVGDICIFKLKGRDIPIVHRVLRIHDHDKIGKELILTKGDNNQVDDRSLYPQGQFWIQTEDIIGRAKGFVPYAGMVTILMNDYPYLKFVVLGGRFFFALPMGYLKGLRKHRGTVPLTGKAKLLKKKQEPRKKKKAGPKQKDPLKKFILKGGRKYGMAEKFARLGIRHDPNTTPQQVDKSLKTLSVEDLRELPEPRPEKPKRPHIKSMMQYAWLESLMETHGTNYRKMSYDFRNIFQHTANNLRKQVLHYIKLDLLARPEKYAQWGPDPDPRVIAGCED